LDQEIQSLRTKNSRTFRDSDGRLVRTYAGSVNYRDTQGDWQPIEDTLVPRVSGDYVLENKANRYKLLVPRDLAAAPVQVDG
jgi:hypothetical protein